MPMRNTEAFVGKAIESVMAQTFDGWELIIVDDGSTDSSLRVAKRYAEADQRITVISNDSHTGMPSAPRNYGIKHARGRYIAFLDSDDQWLPTKLERQLSLLDDDKVAIAFSNYEKTDEEGRRSRRIVKAPRQVDYSDMLHSNYIGNLTGMYDRSKVGTEYLPDIHHEDYALWLSILKKGYIAKNTGTVEALYRVRAHSVSSAKFFILPWQWNIYRHQEHLSLIKSAYYYFCYAINGWKKSKI